MEAVRYSQKCILIVPSNCFQRSLFISLLLFIKAVNAVYNVYTFQRATDINEMLKRDSIYKKQSANISLESSMPILTKISKRLKKLGQQANRIRFLLCNAFLAQYANTEIALQIRRYKFRTEHFPESSRGTVRICIQCFSWSQVQNSHVCIFESKNVTNLFFQDSED